MKDFFEEKERPSLLRRFQLRWNFEYKYYWVDFKKGVSNLIKWFPIIWKDRDYDYPYLLIILKNKLKFLAKEFNNTRYIDSTSSINKINLCINLIEKMNDDYYHLEYLKYHKTNHWFEKIEGSDNFSWENQLVWEKFDDYFKKYPLVYKRILNEKPNEKDKLIIAFNIGRYNQNRARKLLFKVLEENYERWWV